ncbi:RICIN domain-containing protein [Kitasatospora sp. CM 4170]|uniref:RICIN domain-containing protein n=1 Tax=Kitasatospora aburaviensis TaxID=67265 RepID=A0ABW1EPD8_9ACTN|nr:RICIN domain-containing protein [Kitasatospora sp. CM 4170]WNM45220.1 RICIN domain-containing protein [Kitasatospora sp. CM 4170]
MRRTAALFATALLAGAAALTTAPAAGAAETASPVPAGAQAADPAGCTVTSTMWDATGTCTSMDPMQTWRVSAMCQSWSANGIPFYTGAYSSGWVTGNGTSTAWCGSMETIWSQGIALGPTPPSGPTGPVTGYVNKCLDVRGGSSSNGTPIQMWDCLGNVNQNWRIGSDGTIRAVGKCLDVQGGRTGNGTSVQIYDCNGTGAQQWRARPDGAIVNPQSGRVLDVRGWDTANGALVQIWDFNGTANQLWHVPA